MQAEIVCVKLAAQSLAHIYSVIWAVKVRRHPGTEEIVWD